MNMINKSLLFIDYLTDKIGLIFSLLLIPLMTITTMEVISRYVFNRPTIWAWDMNIQIFSALVAIGGSYGLRHNMHVKVDVLVIKLSLRARAILDLVTSSLFFFSMLILLYQSTKNAIEAVRIRETMSTFWAPPIYHIYILVAFGAFLFLLQGIAIQTRNLLTAMEINEEQNK